MYTIIIPGDPVPWKSHRGFGRRSFNPLYKEREYFQWEIKKQIDLDHPILLPVKIFYSFQMKVPKSWSAKKQKLIHEGKVKHVSRPDLTNLIKFTEDCLKELVIKDDSQVVSMEANKIYSDEPKTIVAVYLAGLPLP